MKDLALPYLGVPNAGGKQSSFPNIAVYTSIN